MGAADDIIWQHRRRTMFEHALKGVTAEVFRRCLETPDDGKRLLAAVLAEKMPK